MTTKSFSDRELTEMVNIIGDFEGDPAGTMLLRAHAFIDLRLDYLVQDFNDKDPTLLWARFCLNPIDHCVYFTREKGFNIPGNLNFNAKVDVFESIRLFPKGTSDTLRRMTRVRNKYAHDFAYRLTHKDVAFIFEPLLAHNADWAALIGNRNPAEKDDVAKSLSSHMLILLTHVLIFPEVAHIYKNAASPIYDAIRLLEQYGIQLPEAIRCENWKLDDIPMEGLCVAVKYMDKLELESVTKAEGSELSLDFSEVEEILDKVILFLDLGEQKAVIRGNIPPEFYSDEGSGRQLRLSDLTLVALCDQSWSDFSGMDASYDFGIIDNRNYGESS